MFYEQLYIELGRLFYSIAVIDGKVHSTERESLQKLIQNTWKPLEGSIDRYGTDQANLIDFAFEYEEAESTERNGLDSFLEFYDENKSRFTPTLVGNILQTAETIANAYRGKNNSESKIIDRLIIALSS
ncbi:MAG: hypothetical protein Q8S11_08940 [Daejeonella sp.]|uniref:hypothetical protein n=1 Tax=Daejeonella sp. TaxID=2805397 RepID=UPI002733B4ED|nr:hypothetical protein [Daejeonella sp.]MDP3468447.1 hypothetical protein [Daejeonella sp.]